MRIHKRTMIIYLLLCSLIVLVSCKNNEKVPSLDIDQIRLEVVKQEETPTGTIYTIKLGNNSNQSIIQNNVYISYPIKTENGSKGNDLKVEAKNNKINIKPGDELLLSAFIPKEMVEGNENLDINNPHIEIKGYINEVTERSSFQKGGNYRAMKVK